MKTIAGVCVALLLLPLVTGSAAENQKKRPVAPTGTMGSPGSTMLNINRLAGWYEANGEQERMPGTGNAGMFFPAGTYANIVYSAGIVWSSRYFNDGRTPQLRTNGQSYYNGTKPGAILGLATGIAEDSSAPDVRIWRIRRDYRNADLRQDAAYLNNISSNDVTQPMIDAVRAQYDTDWREWPAAKGAPFYDHNGDGVYTPQFDGSGNPILYPAADEPGLAGADQVTWYVCNDIGVSQPWACPATGIEEQTTIWGFNRTDATGNAVFKRFRLIYKGVSGTPPDVRIDSIYIGQWSDMDIGSYRDDFAGCDTLLNLGYCYNGEPSDAKYASYGLAPAAAGYVVVGGPLVAGAPTDSAIFDLKWVQGKKNLPMTAFVYFASGGRYTDPPFTYQGAIEWNQMLRGLPPQPWWPPEPPPVIDPVTGQPTHFWLSGDPVLRTGWIDGMLDPPGDRRILASSGPFSMALGDTQEFTVAAVAGLGASALESVTELKGNAQNVISVYTSLFAVHPPIVEAVVEYPTATEATVSVIADARSSRALAVTARLDRMNGTTDTSFMLLDDGLHGDGGAHDGVFGNSVAIPGQLAPLRLYTTVTDSGGHAALWQDGFVTTVGAVRLDNLRIFSDNLNDDGRANPGENIRYGFTIRYRGAATLSGLVVAPSHEPQHKSRAEQSFSDGAVDSMVYNPDDPHSYFSMDIPLNLSDSIFNVPVAVYDSSANLWADTLRFRIYPLQAPIKEAVITHSTGPARGEFGISVVYPDSVKNDVYIIEGSNDPLGTMTFTLKDSTAGRVLLINHPFPDSLGHNIPVTDGFKVLRGTIPMVWGWRGYSVPQGQLEWTSTIANGLSLEGFNGAMGEAFGRWYSSSSTPPQRSRDVLLNLAATDSLGNLLDTADVNASFGYRYLRNANLPPAQPAFAQFIVRPDTGFAYQDYHKSVPFAAFDVDSVPPRRLMVGYLENNATKGLVDGKYWPQFVWNNTVPTGPMEWFFIFDVPYSETPDLPLQADIEHTTMPVMWWGTPLVASKAKFRSGDQFEILGNFPYTSQDAWTFNPTVVVNVKERRIPSSFALYQNYPNPFNPSTVISYQLPAFSRVTLKVYNILGQEIRTLVSDYEMPGLHSVTWSGVNDHGTSVSTGVYFYRLTAGGLSQTRKMLLVR